MDERLGSEAPLVSVITPTYQHARYIEQCVRSVMAQRLDARWEMLIGEDGSTDGNREICQRLAEEHPHRIRLLLRDRSDLIMILGRPTGRANLLHLLREAKGKYIALCEGDDYWTDPLKLQKQVDFLEAHPDYSMCFHRAQLLQDGELRPHPIPAEVDLDDVRLEDLLRTYNFIATASVVFRNKGAVPAWFERLPFGDLGLHAIMAGHGRIKCLDGYMSVYRISNAGAWSGLDGAAQYASYLRFYKVLGPHLTAPQRAIVAQKRSAILERMAHARYPVNPTRKRLYLTYLRWLRRP